MTPFEAQVAKALEQRLLALHPGCGQDPEYRLAFVAIEDLAPCITAALVAVAVEAVKGFTTIGAPEEAALAAMRGEPPA